MRLQIGMVIGWMAAGLVGAAAQTTLRIYTGNQPRPEVMREIVDLYMQRNPAVKIDIDTGGTTPEQQIQSLNAALALKEPVVDLLLVDVVRAAQLAQAQWVEPLDGHLGAEKEAVLARYLPALRAAGTVNGKLVALPYAADAQILYYRKDLLDKYGFSPPRTWDELKSAAQKVIEGEKNTALRGLGMAGAPVESTVCTYLVPLWGAGEELLKDGKPNLGGPAARKPFELWADFKAAKLIAANSADVATDRVRQDFQAGNLVFALGWSYFQGRFDGDAESAVKGRVGLEAVPGFSLGTQGGCLGGWQVAVSAASRNKGEAVKFARFLASPEVAKKQALQAGTLPVIEGILADAEVLAAQPWFGPAQNALRTARARPVTPRYPEVSDILRTNTSAVLAGTKTIDAALADMNTRLGAIFK
ncbi:MAG: multiple sugar transport system substrate-binding [Beijerinckiaceae bacterium]|nr:MAG: multiple sugar transport system substrate-binding [Beijerinckiaceae bacterium]